MTNEFRGVPMRDGLKVVDLPSQYESVCAERDGDPKTLADVKAGDTVWMLESYGGMVHIHRLEVQEVKRGRIYTDHWAYGHNAGGVWYRKSGKNADAPKGQCLLVGDTFDFAGWYQWRLAKPKKLVEFENMDTGEQGTAELDVNFSEWLHERGVL